MKTAPLNDFLGIHNSLIPREYLRSSDNILGKSEKFSGMMLVAFSCVCKLSHLILRPISLKLFKNSNRSNSLPIIQYAYAELNLKVEATTERFSILW